MTIPGYQSPFGNGALQAPATPDALRNYQHGMNPDYDRMIAAGAMARSTEAINAKLLREAPGMMNAYTPGANISQLAATKQVKPNRIIAFFRSLFRA